MKKILLTLVVMIGIIIGNQTFASNNPNFIMPFDCTVTEHTTIGQFFVCEDEREDNVAYLEGYSLKYRGTFIKKGTVINPIWNNEPTFAKGWHKGWDVAIHNNGKGHLEELYLTERHKKFFEKGIKIAQENNFPILEFLSLKISGGIGGDFSENGWTEYVYSGDSVYSKIKYSNNFDDLVKYYNSGNKRYFDGTFWGLFNSSGMARVLTNPKEFSRNMDFFHTGYNKKVKEIMLKNIKKDLKRFN